MKYNKITEGQFINRPNRFIANVDIQGEINTVHVKNTGRCGELLLPKSKVYLSVSDNPNRKTKYDLIAVVKETEKGDLLVNMDSQIPNDAAEEWLRENHLFSEKAVIRREVTYGKSRFDFYIEDGERKVFLEVKGVTLENNGIASFPDAPTERGIKHLKELGECIKNGYEAYLLFVIQMKGISKFKPNEERHPAFAEELRNAQKSGVKIIAFDCLVTPDSLEIDKEIPVSLE